MTWYLKNEDGVHGPNDLDQLIVWACDGRIGPEDFLSENATGGWIPASEIPELGMEWYLLLENDEGYGPLNPLAFAPLLEADEIDPDMLVQHRDSGERYMVTALLFAALQEQNQRLRDMLVEHELFTENLVRSNHSPAQSTTAPAGAPKDWSEILQARDRFERESGKWRRLYEQEQESTKALEKRLHDQQFSIDKEHLHSQREVNDLQRRLKISEEILAEFESKTEGSEMLSTSVNLRHAYEDLALKFETIMRQLREKSQLLDREIELRNEMEQSYRSLLTQREEQLDNERELARKARLHAADLESSYHEILKAYRDMNDKIIRLKGDAQVPMNEAPPRRARLPDHADTPMDEVPSMPKYEQASNLENAAPSPEVEPKSTFPENTPTTIAGMNEAGPPIPATKRRLSDKPRVKLTR